MTLCPAEGELTKVIYITVLGYPTVSVIDDETIVSVVDYNLTLSSNGVYCFSFSPGILYTKKNRTYKRKI